MLDRHILLGPQTCSFSLAFGICQPINPLRFNHRAQQRETYTTITERFLGDVARLHMELIKVVSPPSHGGVLASVSAKSCCFRWNKAKWARSDWTPVEWCVLRGWAHLKYLMRSFIHSLTGSGELELKQWLWQWKEPKQRPLYSRTITTAAGNSTPADLNSWAGLWAPLQLTAT